MLGMWLCDVSGAMIRCFAFLFFMWKCDFSSFRLKCIACVKDSLIKSSGSIHSILGECSYTSGFHKDVQRPRVMWKLYACATKKSQVRSEINTSRYSSENNQNLLTVA